MGVLQESYRLYSCARCAVQVRICRACDRGNIYCAGPCARLRREESLRRAGARYQLSRPGAMRHAARQAAWRQRLSDKVTHHGSVLAACTGTLARLLIALLEKADVPAMQSLLLSGEPPTRCSFCGKALSAFSRLGYLRGAT
jgi:hypothetical protein